MPFSPCTSRFPLHGDAPCAGLVHRTHQRSQVVRAGGFKESTAWPWLTRQPASTQAPGSGCDDGCKGQAAAKSNTTFTSGFWRIALA
ncbi:MAG: hypothetical protein ACK520_09820 [Inhella sp.]